ncbi:tyrosine-protein kinase Fyn-like [Oratosquilla oratoria]|uniref:tyrosine-protein kinase Fyn-like n=1 Tax=Oratosquilla oratoria TaxID=337810 RepID=UPI003F75D8E9
MMFGEDENIDGAVKISGLMMVALYDYNARSHHELSLKKGVRLQFLDEHDGVWVKVRLTANGKEGYVPKAYIAPISAPDSQDWFFGEIPRRYAEQLLLDPVNQKGAFLVRLANQATHKYSLSLKDFSVLRGTFIIKHYRIREDDQGNVFMADSQLFSSIHELVEAYSYMSYGLTCTLAQPCKKPAPALPVISWETTDNWEVDRNKIKLHKLLGEGYFGQVWYGLYDDEHEVAVKTLKQDTMTRDAFMKEATVMKTLSHKNIISLYAVCTLQEPIYIITEFMKEGALLSVLKDDEKRETLDVNHLVYISSQIACGMAYLEMKSLVHRDLAARNVLVSDGLLCKIADFGMARNIEGEYTVQTISKFPVKWTAPEVLLYNKFTIKSDVWSFGILLYEIFTYGAIPYPGMTNAQVAQTIPTGYRMPKPTISFCPDPIYEMMHTAWEAEPFKRPTFEHLDNALAHLEITGHTSEYH